MAADPHTKLSGEVETEQRIYHQLGTGFSVVFSHGASRIDEIPGFPLSRSGLPGSMVVSLNGKIVGMIDFWSGSQNQLMRVTIAESAATRIPATKTVALQNGEYDWKML